MRGKLGTYKMTPSRHVSLQDDLEDPGHVRRSKGAVVLSHPSIEAVFSASRNMQPKTRKPNQ